MKKCPKVTFRLDNFFSMPMNHGAMIISGPFHIDPESLGLQVEWGKKVIRSENNPSYIILSCYTTAKNNTCLGCLGLFFS